VKGGRRKEGRKEGEEESTIERMRMVGRILKNYSS
jgi:hypothetical protein